MPTTPDRRTRKRLATRERISQAATRLFLEQGFDHVTVDDVADAADVGRMTVFNHFARKEDMFFDRDDEGREMLRAALRQRDTHTAPVETLRLLAHQLVAERSSYLDFSARGQAFVETVQASETLTARARAIRDELTELVAAELSESAGPGHSDLDAALAANLILATWTVAFTQSHRIFRETQDAENARAAFLAVIDKGSRGVLGAMAGTPYGSTWQK